MYVRKVLSRVDVERSFRLVSTGERQEAKGERSESSARYSIID